MISEKTVGNYMWEMHIKAHYIKHGQEQQYQKIFQKGWKILVLCQYFGQLKYKKF